MTRDDALAIVKKAICNVLECCDLEMQFGTLLKDDLAMTPDQISNALMFLHTEYNAPAPIDADRHRSLSSLCNHVAYGAYSTPKTRSSAPRQRSLCHWVF